MEPAQRAQFLTTDELAERLHVRAQSIYKRYRQTGAYYNLRPVKMPNGRLRWPLDAAEQWAGAAV
ncbi:DNA-binding protein [Caballeronia sp. GAWG1-5s-s]|uniref:DNA-binding protein n=1 Tax=Caballeronia sp. GAWG1-5s-s TaxID=2921743 RepID=UPI00202932EA|nr:DNA-binding protein [Caballeronia sp. GAWG1-5s-s]